MDYFPMEIKWTELTVREFLEIEEMGLDATVDGDKKTVTVWRR